MLDAITKKDADLSSSTRIMVYSYLNIKFLLNVICYLNKTERKNLVEHVKMLDQRKTIKLFIKQHQILNLKQVSFALKLSDIRFINIGLDNYFNYEVTLYIMSKLAVLNKKNYLRIANFNEMNKDFLQEKDTAILKTFNWVYIENSDEKLNNFISKFPNIENLGINSKDKNYVFKGLDDEQAAKIKFVTLFKYEVTNSLNKINNFKNLQHLHLVCSD